MGIWDNRKNKNKIVAIFDIGAGSVGGAIVSISGEQNKDKTPTILAQVRTDIKYENSIDIEKLSFSMNEALHQTAQKLMLLKIGNPHKIYCFLSAPWYVSTTSHINLEKKDKFFTSKKMIDSLMDTELNKLMIQYEEKYKNIVDKPKLMENVVLESKIDGHNVSDIFNKKANNLDLMVYLSMSPDNVLSGIKNTVKRVFPHTDLFCSSFMTAFYNATRLKYPSLESYFLIDINSEATDVCIVYGGVPVYSFSFSIGKNYILNKIITKRNIGKLEAESIFSMYASNTLEKNRKDEISKIMKEVEHDWKNIFYKSTFHIPEVFKNTNLIQLVSYADTYMYFSHILTNKNLKISGDNKFSVSTLLDQDLKELCKLEIGACDEFLMSEALCVAYLYKL